MLGKVGALTISTSSKNGEAHESSHVGDVVSLDARPLASVSLGRTVSLGDYQFARVSVRVAGNSSHFPRSHTHALCRGLAAEILDREIAVVSKTKREETPLSEWSSLYDVVVTIDYGLTLKIRQFESAKIDVSFEQALEGDWEDAVKAIQKVVSDVLEAEAAKVSEMKKATDLGI